MNVITITPVSVAPITLGICPGLHVDIIPVDETPIVLRGVVGIPGPRGPSGALDPSQAIILNGGNF